MLGSVARKPWLVRRDSLRQHLARQVVVGRYYDLLWMRNDPRPYRAMDMLLFKSLSVEIPELIASKHTGSLRITPGVAIGGGEEGAGGAHDSPHGRVTVGDEVINRAGRKVDLIDWRPATGEDVGVVSPTIENLMAPTPDPGGGSYDSWTLEVSCESVA